MTLEEAKQKYTGRMVVLDWHTGSLGRQHYDMWGLRNGIARGDAAQVVDVIEDCGRAVLRVNFGGARDFAFLSEHFSLPEEYCV